METILPSYLALHAAGELQCRVKAAEKLLADCRLCPRQCGVNRLEEEEGVCRTGSMAKVASYAPHFGEERPLVGSGGSGTIFFSHCNLLCVFCQNYEISHLGEGNAVTAAQLAAMMMDLQRQGCHNINFVTPSHVVPQILAGLAVAVERGLTLPLVYNSSGYDSVATLQLLDGVVDIYMPDFKFWDAASATRFAKAKDYPARARAAIKEMHRQVGDLIINDKGLAERGLLVRHLVMPGGLTETARILHFLAAEISTATYVNVMDQYRPCGRAHKYPPLDRPTGHHEYQAALQLAAEAGLTRLDRRDWQRIFRILDLF
jgi:putative pyruvate formate lyase activating enzyme